MSLLVDTFRWFTDPAHWQGSDAISTRIFEHLELSALAVLIGCAIALPIGLYLGHTGRFAFVAVNVVATATLGALVAWGGLGRYIVDGLALQEYDRLFAGALLVAVLAIAVEVAFGTFERLATSPGIRAERATF